MIYGRTKQIELSRVAPNYSKPYVNIVSPTNEQLCARMENMKVNHNECFNHKREESIKVKNDSRTRFSLQGGEV